MPVDDGISNPTDNRPFEDILQTRISRRSVMVGSLATAAVAFVAKGSTASAATPTALRPAHDGPDPHPPGEHPHPGGGLLGFAPVLNADAPAGGSDPVISSDYQYSVIIPWGSALRPGGPDIDGGRPASEAEALEQIGIGHDGMWFFPRGRHGTRGTLCINHEFGRQSHVLGYDEPARSLEDAKISQAVHGVSVVDLRYRNGEWQPTRNRRSRRITPNTPVVYDGPVAGHPLLDTPAGLPPAGTVNNCANGYTPWKTYLTCEENFNGYFGWNDPNYVPTEAQERYGFRDGGFGYGWHLHEDRWDLSNPDHAQAENRFGWIVEIDPRDPDAPPMKHTALGRFKHEGIALTEAPGRRIVGYMGDDERFDYIYKFVSAGNWRRMRRDGKSPLSEGKLYAAKFHDDGHGEWLELTIDAPALAAKFADQAEVLTYARLAADILGATPMDRPEWTTIGHEGEVFCTLTNNTRRTPDQVDAANPLGPNPDGHIIRWYDDEGGLGTTFQWDIFLLSQDTHGTDYSFGSPDGIWADPDGRVFIQTDGGQPDTNNQLLVADSHTREIRRLFVGVDGDEITGVTVTPDRRTLFVNTQHPGNGDPTRTNFPIAGAGGPQIPRDATFVITRRDGGIVGS